MPNFNQPTIPCAGMAVIQVTDFQLSSEFIPLDALLKTAGLADSGGAAKAMVAAGQVQVDGQLELRKRCKIRSGQVVSVGSVSVRVIGPRQDNDSANGQI